MRQPKKFKQITKFHLFIVAGIIWIIVLAIFMILQSVPPIIDENQTLKTLSLIEHNVLNSEPITPLPEPKNLNLAKVTLGFKLFSDSNLSGDKTISCTSCHNLYLNGAGNVSFSVGINGSLAKRNTPTVFNSGFSFRQFWDGRALTLEEQVEAPFLNSQEMGASWDEIITTLMNSSDYRERFKQVYGKNFITPDQVRDAISTFERTLVTTNSRFDKWLKGDEGALSHRQKEGYQLFKSYGCIKCHQGVNVGGNMFERLGVFREYYLENNTDNTKRSQDLGRFAITKNEETLYEFKVPSLRNIALTSPYLHDGSIKKLRNVIDIMATYQLGLKLPEAEIEKIEDFLSTLTGEPPTILR